MREMCRKVASHSKYFAKTRLSSMHLTVPITLQNNTCPLCRAQMDRSVPSAPTQNETQAEPMLRLFQSMIGHAREEGVPGGEAGGMAGFGGAGLSGSPGAGRGPRPREDDEFNSMYS